MTENRYKTLKVIILSSKELTPSDAADDYYIGPEVGIIELDGINCSVDQFFCLFLKTEVGGSFCSIGGTASMIDFGDSGLDLTPGKILAVSFDECFHNRLQTLEKSAKEHIELMADAALKKLGVLI